MENTIENISNEDLLLKLYLYVEEELKVIEPAIKAKSLPRDRRGRKAKLTAGEIITMLLFGMVRGYRDKKKLYNALYNYHRREFPTLPAYSKFVQASNSVLLLLAALLERWLAFNREHMGEAPTQLGDASALPVCKNPRISSHKVFAAIARRSKTTLGWFYGLKLHVECDTDGNLTKVAITRGNCDDRNLVDGFTEWMAGGILILDAGYVDKQRGEELAEEGISYLTGVRKNMKKVATLRQLALLRLRQMVETVFSVIKERLLLIRSTHRAVVAGLSHFVTCLLGYCLKKAGF